MISRAMTALNDRIRAFQLLSITSTDYAKEFAQIQAKYKQVGVHFWTPFMFLYFKVYFQGLLHMCKSET